MINRLKRFFKNKNKIKNSILLMCFLSSFFYCYEYYLRIAPCVMRLDLIQVFKISDSELGILFSFYYYAYVPLQLPVGIMMDKYGARFILSVSCLLCAFGTFIFAYSNDIFIAKIGRFLLGFGSAFSYIGVLKIANLWLPKKYFALVVGVASCLGMIGAMMGEIFMSKFIIFFGWRYTLYYASFIGFIMSIALYIFIKDKNININIIKKGRKLIFEVLKIIKIKQLWINGIIGCFLYLPLTIFAEMWAIPFLEESGLNKTNASIGSGLIFFGFAFGGPTWGIITEMISNRKKILIMGSCMTNILIILIIYFIPKTLFLIYSCLFLLGFFTSVQVLVFVISNDICGVKLSATAMSFTNMLIMTGGVFFQPLVGIFLDFLNIKIYGYEVHHFVDYQMALFILPLCLFLSTILIFLLNESYIDSYKTIKN